MPNLARQDARRETPSSELAGAFAATDYRVRPATGPITVRIGSRHPALDRALGNRQWAIITACNPGGTRQSAAANEHAHQRLEQALDGLEPAVVLPACNRDPSGVWPDERGWLWTCPEVEQADRLAREFGQCAVVTGKPGGPARLRLYGQWRDELPRFAEAVDH